MAMFRATTATTITARWRPQVNTANLCLCDEENATERQQCATVWLLRVGRSNAIRAGSKERAVSRFVERIEIGSQGCAFDPCEDGVVTFKDVQVFGFPNVDSVCERCENLVVAFGRLCRPSAYLG